MAILWTSGVSREVNVSRWLVWLGLATAVLVPALVAGQTRTMLTAPHWIAVQPGQDATAAIALAQRTLDTAGQPVIVVLSPGQHGRLVVSGPMVGNGRVTITGGPGVQAEGLVVQAGASVTVQGVRFANTSGPAIAAVDKAWVDLGDGLEFGAVGAEHLMSSYGSVIYARTSAYIVSGGAVSHAHAYGRASIILPEPLVITVTQPVVFQAYVYGAAIGDIHARASWQGASVSGPRALIHYSSLLYAAGKPLPGDGTLTVDGDSVVVE